MSTSMTMKLYGYETIDEAVEHEQMMNDELINDLRAFTCAQDDMIVYKKAKNIKDDNFVIVKLRILKGTRISVVNGEHVYARVVKTLFDHFPNASDDTLINFTRDKIMTLNKCRAECAVVEDIYYADIYDNFRTATSESDEPMSAYSLYDNGFEYHIGQTVVVDNYKHSKGICAPGIHFFMKESDARDYNFN